MKIVPIYLLSGFLGSGKTTLLVEMVERAQAAGLTPAVLMNELGEINFDGQLISREVAMAEVLGGCICCSMRGDLSLELNQLLEQYKPDLVIVESTGAANPLESIDAITETSMYKHVKLQHIVTVVDSEHLLSRSKSTKDKTYRLMQEQIRCASMLLLNKVDRLHVEQVVEAQQLVRELNRKAELVTTTHAKLEDWRWLLEPALYGDDGYDGEDKLNQLLAQLHHEGDVDNLAKAHGGHSHEGGAPEDGGSKAHATHEHGDHEAHGVHEHGDHAADHSHTHSHVMAYTHYWQQPPHSEQFEAWLAQLPASIYRAKGIVTFRDLPSRYMFQFAYRESDFMRIEPQGTVHDVAVFIGEHFDQEWLKQELAKLEKPSATED